MFLMVKNLIIYLNILLYTCAPLPKNNEVIPTTEVSTTIDIQPIVQMEIVPFKDLLNELNLVTPLNDNDILIKGKILGKLEEIVKQAVKAENKNEILIKDQGRLEKEKNAVELELKRIKAPLSVRERIEFWEHMLSPAFKQTKQFTKTEDEISFHENRWLFILNNRQYDPMVKRLLAFIKSREKDGMSKKVFARRISGFFHFASYKIHVPPLESYTTEELKQELKLFFGESYDNLTLDVVCAFGKESP